MKGRTGGMATFWLACYFTLVATFQWERGSEGSFLKLLEGGSQDCEFCVSILR